MTIKLFVGDCDETVSDSAKKIADSAYLIDFSNFEDFLKLDCDENTEIVAYTSIADLPKITLDRCVLFEILLKADWIYYSPPSKWSDYSDEFSLGCSKTQTEYFLYLLQQQKKNVIGLDLNEYSISPYLALRDTRKTEKKNLWVTGCSVTLGVGVKFQESYPFLLAQKFFDSKFSNLSQAASSLEYQADQILRSDIQKGDVVVWGLTSEYRAVYWNRKKKLANSINPYGFDYIRTNAADDICDETRLYKAVILCNQVTNYCQKIGATLFMVPILCSEKLQLALHDNPCYYQMPYTTKPIDLGTDRAHPGPKHHQYYFQYISEVFTSTFAKEQL